MRQQGHAVLGHAEGAAPVQGGAVRPAAGAARGEEQPGAGGAVRRRDQGPGHLEPQADPRERRAAQAGPRQEEQGGAGHGQSALVSLLPFFLSLRF